MLPHPSETDRDRALLRNAPHDHRALEELANRYLTDIFQILQRHLYSYNYDPRVLQDMALDCLGKLCEDHEWIIDYYGDLDTAVAKTAAIYARVELRNALTRR